jgi:hypothetical protein
MFVLGEIDVRNSIVAAQFALTLTRISGLATVPPILRTFDGESCHRAELIWRTSHPTRPVQWLENDQKPVRINIS